MNLVLLIILLILSTVNGLRPFQNCRKCSFNKSYLNRKLNQEKNSNLNFNNIWDDYEKDPNPPINFKESNMDNLKIYKNYKFFRKQAYNKKEKY